MERKGIYLYNDYELIYYAKQKEEWATEILLEKYKFLIWARIKKYHINQFDQDDYFQEGCLVLIKCIRNFNENSKSSFTNFFDLVLCREFVDLLRKSWHNKVEFIDDLDLIKEEEIESFYLPNGDFGFSCFEECVYNLSYSDNLSVKEISERLNVSSRKVVNAKQRIIEKMRLKLNISEN